MVRGKIRISGHIDKGTTVGADNSDEELQRGTGVIQQEDNNSSGEDGSEVGEAGDTPDLDDLESESGEPAVNIRESIDPGQLAGTATVNASGEPKQRRKRGPNKSKTTFEKSSNIEKLLFSGHAMLAKLLDADFMAIDQQEAKMLSSAIQEVNEAYGFPVLSPKTQAMISFAMACGAVYGPRVVMLMAVPKKGPVLVPHAGTSKPTTTA